MSRRFALTVAIAAAASAATALAQGDVPLDLWVPYQAAVEERALGHYDAAEQMLGYVIEKAPRCMQARVERGLVRTDQGALDDAIADFDAALAIDGYSATALSGRAIARMRDSDAAGAQADYERALTIDPKLGDALWGLGWLAQQRGDDEEAWRRYDAWVAAEPDRPEAWSARAGAEEALGRFDQARQDLQHVAALQPTDPQVHLRLATLLRGQDDLDTALTEIDAALRIDPGLVDGWLARSATQAERGYDRSALTAAKRAVELAPQDYRTLWRRAYARRCEEDYSGAIADYDAAIALAPNEVDIYVERGFARECVDDFAGALADFSRYLEGHPGEPWTLHHRAYAEQQLSRFAAAADDYEAAAKGYEQQGDDSAATEWAYAGWAQLRSGRREAALADFEQATSQGAVGFGLTLTRRGRARALASLGKLREAADTLAEVEEDDMQSVECALDAAVVAAQLGEWESALADLDRFVRGVRGYDEGGWPLDDDPGGDAYFQALIDAGAALARDQPEVARAAAGAASKARPRSALAHVVLARARRAAGDLQGALSELASVEIFAPDQPALLRERAELFEALGDAKNAAMERERADRLEQEQPHR